jgi:orotidine-5'-phosphate decarboxylase
MIFSAKLDAQYELKKSLLCVGLDPDWQKVKNGGFKGSLFDFNKLLIDATAKYAICFKPQVAYYSAYAKEDELEKTIDYIRSNYQNIPIILDAKRGDIGPTAAMYAKEAFERYNVDSVTVNPYMGADCIQPFLTYSDKSIILLARTSNASSDIQDTLVNGMPLYMYFLKEVLSDINFEQVSFVVGAQCKSALELITQEYPNTWLLVPGLGAQGGTVTDVLQSINRQTPRVLLSVSRGLTNYANNDAEIFNFAQNVAQKIFAEML